MKILREVLWPLAAVFAAFVVGGIIVLLIGDNPFLTYYQLIGNSFGSLNDIGYTLFIATPLIFTGLAVAVAFRCGLLNIGAEGQLYVAAFATAWVGIKFGGTMVNVFGKQEDWSWYSLPAVAACHSLRGHGCSRGWHLGRDPGNSESKVRLARSYQYDHAELYRHLACQLFYSVLLQGSRRSDPRRPPRSARPPISLA